MRQYIDKRGKYTRKILRTLPILVLAAVLFSACTRGKITPPETAQTTRQPNSPPTPKLFGSPTVAPVVEPTAAPNISPTDEPISNVVHLGVVWADFSLRFDPLQWEVSAFNDDLPDLQILAHRVLAGCCIAPNIPVGLGEGWTIEKRPITFGQLELEVRSFYQSGALKFVGYYNFVNPYGDGAVEVHFEDNSVACLQAAEALFAATEVILP